MMMNKNEFIKKAKEYGYTDEDIEECIQLQLDAKKDGITIDLADLLVKRPYDSKPSTLKE